jgi:hypothetical protein
MRCAGVVTGQLKSSLSDAAKQGERDPEILHQQALETVGIEKTADTVAADVPSAPHT